MIGAGLFLLRVSIAYWLSLITMAGNVPLWQQLGILLIGLGVAIGFHARLLAILCLMFGMARILGSATTLVDGIPAVLSAAALALLGAGAYSIDARLFGRRTLIAPDL